MPKVTLTIDGKTVETTEGTLVIEAAKAAGIEVPHYCYHPGLGNPGVCRLCVVSVEGAPKLQVSCRLKAQQGMVVRSNSPEARQAQAASLEFHLVNHPLDCPVCDQAGECWLQDYYMRYGLYRSSVREDKGHKRKRLKVGPRVMLDAERCILCTRCTRFLDNVTKTRELGIFDRGSHSELLPYPGKSVDNPYAGNIVDICPVGALTDLDFRFAVRVWYLDRTPSVCTGCSRGCSIEIHSNTQRPWHAEGRRVVRLKPRYNPEVNGYWMCDEGRYSYKSVDAPDRLRNVSLLEDGRLSRLPWPEAAGKAAKELEGLVQKRGPGGLAVVLSGTLSNEDLYAARMLFSGRLKAGHILLQPGPDQLGEEDELLRRREKVPNLRGAQALGFGSKIAESSWQGIREALMRGELWGLYAIDRDPAALLGEESAEALGGLAFTAYQGPAMNAFARLSRWVFPACSWAEQDATYVNCAEQVQLGLAAVPAPGDCWPDWRIFGALLKALGADFPWTSAEGIFSELARAEREFSGLAWGSLGAHGRRLGGAQAVSAGGTKR